MAVMLQPAAAGLPMLTPELAAKYAPELVGVALILIYLLNAYFGAQKNKEIATNWIRVLGEPDNVLARNFAVHGSMSSDSDKELWWKESNTSYKCYASGRRYCTGAMITLNLKPRQDMLFELWHMLVPQQDTLTFDVFLGEGGMPLQSVLALGQPKAVRALLRDEGVLGQGRRLGDFAKPMQVARERVPGGWPNDKLAVAAEAPSLLYDILNAEPAIAKGFVQGCRWLRSGVASSEVAQGSNPAGPRVTFELALPPVEKADEISMLLSCVLLLVDLLGSYKPSAEMKKRAADLRASLQQEAAKKGSQDRQEQLAQKRMEKLEAERAKARAAGPLALAKFDEKHQAKMRNREMRKRTMRVG
ncbi:hypothetical protein OEZ86_007707 [Tetradesmus obliquus]|nr:hypothetical protein OEZ86_007707 [Tetradesmus obliquus]